MFNKPIEVYMVRNTNATTELDQENRSTLPTDEAAYHLNRSEQITRLS